jgi:hypothetical protein
LVVLVTFLHRVSHCIFVFSFYVNINGEMCFALDFDSFISEGWVVLHDECYWLWSSLQQIIALDFGC